MTIAVISHPDCFLHNMGVYHPEQPARLLVIEDELSKLAATGLLKAYQAPLATEEQLLRVHSKKHLDSIAQAVPQHGMIAFAPDVNMNPHSLKAALRAAGAGIYGVDLVMTGEVKQVFCNVRPPGHHAEREAAMGFCLFNNVAVAVAHALDQYQLKRIAIVDFDVHHGNGTEDIFRHDERVLYCSSFQSPFYPFGGTETQSSHIINIPLSAGTSSELFREKTASLWFEQIREFAPELIFFSAGFDAYAEDELADLFLKEEDYFWITKEIKKIANDCCKGQIISVLEGGYSLEGLGLCAAAHIKGLDT